MQVEAGGLDFARIEVIRAWKSHANGSGMTRSNGFNLRGETWADADGD